MPVGPQTRLPRDSGDKVEFDRVEECGRGDACRREDIDRPPRLPIATITGSAQVLLGSGNRLSGCPQLDRRGGQAFLCSC
jgi:hypothetical protein